MASALLCLVLLFCSYCSIAHGVGEHNYMVVTTSSLKPTAICSNAKVIPMSNRTSLLLTHRHGPCSPVHSKHKPSFIEMLRQDNLRADYIQRKVAKNAGMHEQQFEQSAVSIPTTMGASLNTLEYVVTVGFGMPAVTQTMIIDTGSDVSWVQCTPCRIPPCHPQKDPIFDPNKSSTYAAFSCNSTACAQLGSGSNGCSSSQCQYIVKYGDGSNTVGTYSSDTLTLTSSDVVKNFQFGCSHRESNFNDHTDGLMGLGGNTQSLVSQTAQTYGKAFSYCLPPSPSSSGFLALGAPGSTSGFVRTPMLRSSKVPTFYGVLLQAITVAGHKLDVPAAVFSANSVMDSGTIITRLPPTAYTALRSAFNSEMSMYPPAPSTGILDTCYDFSKFNTIRLPKIALVFAGGAVADLDGSGILSGNCLAFAPTSSDSATGIIGNVQQRTFEVLYDVGGGTVGFRPGAC